MSRDHKRLLDDIGWKLLGELQANARISFAELGRRVGLSLPAVAERVRRMEEAGFITGYRAEVSPATLGWPVMAFIQLSTPAARYPAVIALARDLPGVLECHHLTGTGSFIMKVVAVSLEQLETLIAQLSIYGQTETSIVLSSPVSKQVIEPGEEAVKFDKAR